MNKKLSTYSIAGLLLLFPWRDALALMVHGTPIRAAEIWLFISAILLLLCPKRKKDRYGYMLIGILGLNLINTIVGVVFHDRTVVVSFAIKYIARNLFYLIVLAIFLYAKYEVKEKHIDFLMKYLVWVQLLACLFTVVTNKHLLFGSLISTQESFDANYINVAGHLFHRLKGTCSEPGYIAPLIAIALYYFLVRYFSNWRKRNKSLFYVAILLIISLFTFSSAVYLLDFIVILLALTTSKPVARKYVLILLGGILLVGCIIFVVGNDTARNFFYSNFADKIRYYVFRDSTVKFNYSAVDRSQHVDLAKKLIEGSNVLELLFGRGTGAYYFNSLKEDAFLQNDVSEANNIYLSTMVDRGIIGLCCVTSTFWICFKKWVRADIYSSTLFIGIMMQGIHWMVTGNFWLYYFWINIILLFGYHRYQTSVIGDR